MVMAWDVGGELGATPERAGTLSRHQLAERGLQEVLQRRCDRLQHPKGHRLVGTAREHEAPYRLYREAALLALHEQAAK